MIEKLARGGGGGGKAFEASINARKAKERAARRRIAQQASESLADTSLLRDDEQVNADVQANTEPQVASVEDAPHEDRSSGTGTTTKKVSLVSGSGRHRAPVSIKQFVNMLASGSFDHTKLDKEFLMSFPVDARLKGGPPVAFDDIVKPLVVEGTNRVLASFQAAGTPYMSGDEARKLLSVRRDVSPAAFGFKATKEVPVGDDSSKEEAVRTDITSNEDWQDFAADSVNYEQPVADTSDYDIAELAQEARKTESANASRRTRRADKIKTVGKYSLGAVTVAALAYLAYKQYKKIKKRKLEKKAGLGDWADRQLENRVPSWLVRDYIQKKYNNSALRKALDLLSMAKTKEDVDYLNKMYPRLAFEINKFIDDTFMDKGDLHEDKAAVASQMYDRFSAEPGGELAKPLDEADVINSRIYSAFTPNPAAKTPEAFDPRQAAFRSLAAAMRSPFGVPRFGTEAWDSPYYLSPYWRGGSSYTPEFLEADAGNMFADNPEAKFYPSIANIGYAMPAVIGDYARNWMPGVDPNKIFDQDDRTALVEGALASIPQTYPSVRNAASMLMNGYAGRQEDYAGPLEYKSDGSAVLLPGEKGYDESEMPVVYRGPLWDYNAQALTPAGSNAWHSAVSSVYAPQLPAMYADTDRKVRSYYGPSYLFDSYHRTHGLDGERAEKLHANIARLAQLNTKEMPGLRARLDNADAQYKRAVEAGDAETAESFRELMAKLTAEYNTKVKELESLYSDEDVKTYNAAHASLLEDGHFYDMKANMDATFPSPVFKKNDKGQYVRRTPLADSVASGVPTVDDEWSKKIIPMAYNEGLKLFDAVGPYWFQPDTVVGPHALYANPGGVISDAVSAFDTIGKDYEGRWNEVADNVKESTKDVAGRAQKKIMGSSDSKE